jgi:acetylglutamate kinase
VAVVHGGGSALTQMLKRLGKQSEFIGGLRVTDAETRDVALMVLGGIVNKKLVAAIQSAGMPAVGFCGGDGMTFRARRKPRGNDLGFVGEICYAEPCWIEALWQQGGIPVIASLALGADGEYYNVNADEMAAACAAACHANALIFLTDVPGVKRRRRNRHSVAEHETGAGYGRRIGRQRRHVAQARSLPAGVEARRRPSADIARHRSRSSSAVLSHETELWHRGDLRMSSGTAFQVQNRSQS